MKAVIYHGPGNLRLEEVEVPSVGPGEVLVKVRAALTCGTDLKTYQRGHHLLLPPAILGHEFSGEVTQIGEGVSRFKEGMRVMAVNSAPCNNCFFCRRGQHNLCENTLYNFGAFAEYVRVPARIVEQNMYPIPEDLSHEEAALLEPLACVVLGNEAANIHLGDTVAIAGGTGPIGLMHLQLAFKSGAREVIAIGLKDDRWPVARELGARHLIDAASEDPVAKVKELTGGRGADVVIEATGVPQVWEMAIEMARKGGRIVLFGGCPAGTSIKVDTGRLHYEALTIKGVFHHTPGAVGVAAQLLTSGAVKANPLITCRLPLGEVERGLNMMAEGKAVKVALIP